MRLKVILCDLSSLITHSLLTFTLTLTILAKDQTPPHPNSSADSALRGHPSPLRVKPVGLTPTRLSSLCLNNGSHGPLGRCSIATPSLA